MKILILASNPSKDLYLDREIRDLKNAIERSQNGAQFEVEIGLAVRVSDLQALLLKHRPAIVHFCGHGGGAQGLVFENDQGETQWISTAAIAGLFRLFASTVKGIVLNACYSEVQAKAIVNDIDYVIGMQQAIRDDAAIAFSKGFYQALAFGCDIEQSYELGCNAIQLEISGSSKTQPMEQPEQRKAIVMDVVQNTAIPEYLKPTLLKKPNSTAISLVDQPADQQLTETSALQLKVDQVLSEDARRKQYSERVREFLADRKLTALEKLRLEQIRKNLNLSVEAANQILEQAQAPIRKAQTEYREMLFHLIEQGYYPFAPDTELELQRLSQELNLTEAEVNLIETPILTAAAAAYAKSLSSTPETPLQTIEFEFATLDQAVEHLVYQPGVVQGLSENLGNGILLDMVAIPGGSFYMGAATNETGAYNNERPQHRVTLQPFLISKFAVTQAQWQQVASLPRINCDLNPDPAQFKGADRPVESISWDEAIEFCHRLTQLTGKPYRLPTEAEWEYSCRAGTSTPFHYGETITADLANYNGNCTYESEPMGVFREETVAVGSFPPNAFGLYDFHGNVWEWCADYWHENYQQAPTDGTAWIAGGNDRLRVLRGGSWDYDPRSCRSAARDRVIPEDRNASLGFRVVCRLN